MSLTNAEIRFLVSLRKHTSEEWVAKTLSRSGVTPRRLVVALWPGWFWCATIVFLVVFAIVRANF